MSMKEYTCQCNGTTAADEQCENTVTYTAEDEYDPTRRYCRHHDDQAPFSHDPMNKPNTHGVMGKGTFVVDEIVEDWGEWNTPLIKTENRGSFTAKSHVSKFEEGKTYKVVEGNWTGMNYEPKVVEVEA